MPYPPGFKPERGRRDIWASEVYDQRGKVDPEVTEIMGRLLRQPLNNLGDKVLPPDKWLELINQLAKNSEAITMPMPPSAPDFPPEMDIHNPFPGPAKVPSPSDEKRSRLVRALSKKFDKSKR